LLLIFSLLLLLLLKNKSYKLDLNDRIENYKDFDEMTNKNNKKLKALLFFFLLLSNLLFFCYLYISHL
jgi:hypothetical protein